MLQSQTETLWQSLIIGLCLLIAALSLAAADLLCVIHSYRAIPTFGRATIQCFMENCSDMKYTAARNFEDLLQVCDHLNFGLLSYYLHSSVQSPHLKGFLISPMI